MDSFGIRYLVSALAPEHETGKASGPNEKPESSQEDPGRNLQDRLRLAHLPLQRLTDGPACPTHAHGHDLKPAFPLVQH